MTSTNPFLSPIPSQKSTQKPKSLSKFYLKWLNNLFQLKYRSYTQLNDCIAYHVFFDYITRRGTSLHTIAFPERLEDLYERHYETQEPIVTEKDPVDDVKKQDTLKVPVDVPGEMSRGGMLSAIDTSFNISVQSATPLPEEEVAIPFARLNASMKGENRVEPATVSISRAESPEEPTAITIYPPIISLSQCRDNAALLSEIIQHHHILLSDTIKKRNILENLTKQDEQIHYTFLKFCHTYWKRYYRDLNISEYKPQQRIQEAWKVSEENRKAYIEEESKFGHKEVVSDEEVFRKAFRMVDLDGNGELDLQEIQEFALSAQREDSDDQLSSPENIEALKLLMKEAKGDAECLTENRFVQYMMEQKRQQDEAERMEQLKAEAKAMARLKARKKIAKARLEREHALSNVDGATSDLHPMVLHEEDFSFLRQVKLKSMLKERKKKSKHDERLKRLTNLATPPNYSKYAEEHEIRYTFRPTIISEVPPTSRAPPKSESDDDRTYDAEKRKKKGKRNKKHGRRTSADKLRGDNSSRLPPFTAPALKGRGGAGEKRRSTYEQEHRLQQGETIISAALRESRALAQRKKNSAKTAAQKTFLEHAFAVQPRRRNSTKHVVKCKACGQQLDYHKRHNHLCDLSKIMQHRHRHSQPTILSHYDPNNYIHRLWKRAAEERERFEMDRELNGLAADEETERLLQNYYNFPTIQKASNELEIPLRHGSISLSPLSTNSASRVTNGKSPTQTRQARKSRSPSKDVSPYEEPLFPSKGDKLTSWHAS